MFHLCLEELLCAARGVQPGDVLAGPGAGARAALGGAVRPVAPLPSLEQSLTTHPVKLETNHLRHLAAAGVAAHPRVLAAVRLLTVVRHVVGLLAVAPGRGARVRVPIVAQVLENIFDSD